jgi:hypothetical protein
MPKILTRVTRGLDIMYSIITFLKIEQVRTTVHFTRPYARRQQTFLSMSAHGSTALTAAFKPKSRNHFCGFTVTATLAYGTLDKSASYLLLGLLIP